MFELKNSKHHAAWLVSLQMREQLHIPPEDALALRLFLSQRVETALGMEPKSLHMVLNFNTEAKRLALAESVIEPKWLKIRMNALLASASKASSSVAAQAASPIKATPASPAPAQAASVQATRAAPLAPGQKPVSARASTQEKKMKELLASLTDDDLYEVKEASMTDFDRALL